MLNQRASRFTSLAMALTLSAAVAAPVAAGRDRDRDRDRDRYDDRYRDRDDRYRDRDDRYGRDRVRLGSKRVDGRRDEDTIDVDARGRFRAIQFRVTDDNAWIRNVVVRFENGERFRPQIQEVFSQGGRSRLIDLPGRSRDIDSITFRYGNIRGGRAEVVVWGIR